MSSENDERLNDNFLANMAGMMSGSIDGFRDGPTPIYDDETLNRKNANQIQREQMLDKLEDIRDQEQPPAPKPKVNMEEMQATPKVEPPTQEQVDAAIEAMNASDDEDDEEPLQTEAPKQPEPQKTEKAAESVQEGVPSVPTQGQQNEANSISEPSPEPEKVEEKASKPRKSTKKKQVKVVDPETAEKMLSEGKNGKKKNVVHSELGDVDDLDERIAIANNEVLEEAREKYIRTEIADDLSVEELNQTIDNLYEDDDATTSKKASKVKINIVSDESGDIEKVKKDIEETPKRARTVEYNNTDGNDPSFKLRVSKTSKIVRDMEIDNTEEIETTNISSKTAQERQKIYINTVFPTLQPTISVVPCIVSGVVIAMKAFAWPDIMEICDFEDKLSELEPGTTDYIYEKNKLFIEKRRKQLELFYKNIQSVSGYEVKPSFDELFGSIIKFPDFQQLFFAAYTATFPKSSKFILTCGTCGTENELDMHPRELCFLLNTNVNIKQLNHYIERGSSLDKAVTAEVYREFQAEKFVEMANRTYRVKKPLPTSAFMYDMKIPTILDAIQMMTDIAEIAKDKDLSYTDPETGYTIYIDSTMGLTRELVELRNYLYLDKLIVPRVVGENKEENTASVSFIDFDDKDVILNSIYSLSHSDYKALMNDETLTKLIRVSGIRHAIKGGNCVEPTCGSDLGNIPVEPETLFFTIARQG